MRTLLAAGTDLLPTSRRAQAEVLRWMFFEQYSHEPTLAVLRYLRLFSSEPSRHLSRVNELIPKARHALSVMQTQLESHSWIAGEECSVADYSLYPYTRSADQSGLDLIEFPAVESWVARIEQLPRFIVMGTDGSEESLSFSEYPWK